MELVPLKVKILIKGKEWSNYKQRGHAFYPDFNLLQCIIDAGLDWSYYVDQYGGGWHYDKQSGHKEEDGDNSPHGLQWGVLLVPEEFAEQAEALYPKQTEIISEAEFETFYNDRAHAHEASEKLDADILAGIKSKQDLGLDITAEQTAALNPEDPTPGIVKNKNKIFTDYKTVTGITIKPGVISKVKDKDKFSEQVKDKTLLIK